MSVDGEDAVIELVCDDVPGRFPPSMPASTRLVSVESWPDKKFRLNSGDDTFPRYGCRPARRGDRVGDLPTLLGGLVADSGVVDDAARRV
ncbi:hypothetical protein RQCS_58350 (plasmid) [Rhodococcus qingshengii]|uniref:hypothetical protein n=1 Tax=Rhodococcus qingshengii TaxID=334542 RepID=UPI000AC74D49|nr:hypothetical protein [Rhodococcus qingshengii]BCF86290.1 hypothetical protein RQCS_58350 [Rhodococcus qingshengii]